MIAYNTDWLEALLTKDTAQKWHEKGLLSNEKWKEVQERNFSNFYTPNIFVRIGLSIFTWILLISAAGIVGVFLEPNGEIVFTIFSLFCGVSCIMLMEWLIIKTGRHKASGVDDMMLYAGCGAIITAFCYSLDYNTPPLVYCCIALPFLIAGSIRYLDRLMVSAAFGCLLFIILLVVKEIPVLALYLLPFAGMLFSAAVCIFSRQGQSRYNWRHWHGLLIVLEMLSLVTFYASGNFWIVQQAGAAWFQLEQVPLAWFFWTFTFVVPLIYIFEGLRRKDRILLDLGLGCVAAAVFSFRYYYHVMSLSWAVAIGGAVLFLTAYFSIRYLHKNEGAYTYEEDSETSMLQEIEQQLIEQTIANQPGPTPDKSASFGGGQFGGGGAGADF